MNVVVMRIDDRLIHGQIVTAWISNSKAQMIIVADDLAVKDSLQQTMLKMATPAGVTLKILSIQEASELFASDTTDKKVLLLVRNPGTALQLLNSGFHIESINVGNVSNSRSVTGRKKILSYLYLEEVDAQNLKAISDKGIKLDVRSVPTDKSQDGLVLINKNF